MVCAFVSHIQKGCQVYTQYKEFYIATYYTIVDLLIFNLLQTSIHIMLLKRSNTVPLCKK